MGATVVVIEDDMLLADIISDTLRDEGFVVKTFSEAVAALEYIIENQPALVLTDAHLRDGTASELVAKLHSINPRPAVVVMSGMDPLASPGWDIEHAQGFLQKPFDLSELLAVVARYTTS